MKTTNRTTKSTKVTSLKWTALDKAPTKRWWWYGGFIVIGLWFILLLTMLQQWTTVAVAVAVMAAFLVVYLWRPHLASMTLDAKNIVVNGQTFPIERFSSFRIDGEGEQTRFVLVPKKRLALPVLLAPSGWRIASVGSGGPCSW